MPADASARREFDAQAVVKRWTPNHLTADIVQDGKAIQARCPANINRLQPVPGKPFHCRVRQEGDKYTVIGFHTPAPSDELRNVQGKVHVGSGGKAVLKIDHGDFYVAAFFDRTALYPAFIHSFVHDAEVTASVRADGVSYKAFHIAAPSAYAACDTSKDDVTRNVIAFVTKDWRPDAQGQVQLHFRELDTGEVFAQIYVNPQTLRSAGIKALTVAGEHTATRQASLEKIREWHTLYQAGVRNEPPAVDRLEIEVEWLPEKNKWRLQRLLRPRATLLHGAKQVFDWITCTVTAITHDPMKRPAAGTAPDDGGHLLIEVDKPDEEMGDTPKAAAEAGNNWESADYKIEVDYDDEKTDVGVATGRMTKSMLDASDLKVGHQIITTLTMYEGNLGIKSFHRRLPEKTNVQPC